MSEIERQEIKGHILKQITIRMDYNDIIKVSDVGLKEIRTLCTKFGLEGSITRILDPVDFHFSDYLTDLSIPYEYLKDITSHIFMSDDQTLTVEVNQLFLKINQDVGTEYTRFSEMETIFIEINKILELHEQIRVKRLSLNKVNEVYYLTPDKLLNDFKHEIIGLDVYKGLVDWMNPTTQMNQTINFESEGLNINVIKLLDNGTINNNPLIRLLLQFEVLCVNTPYIKPSELLSSMNTKVYDLFKASLSENGLKKIIDGERLGEFHYE